MLSLKIRDSKIQMKVHSNENFVDTIACSKLLLAKVVQSMHPLILVISILAKVVHYVHSSLFKSP